MALGKVGGNQLETTLNIDSGTLYVDGTNNRVGIGSVSPDSPLEISNSASGTADAIELTNFSGTSSYIKAKRGLTLSADYDNNSGGSQSYIGFETDAAERMRIDASGIVTKPYQPSFLAGNPNSTFTGATGVDGSYSGVIHNVGNHYNSSNGRFTAPVSGTYHFWHQVSARQTTNSGYEIKLYKNTTVELARVFNHGSGSYHGGFCSATVYLNANDYVQPGFYNGSSVVFSGNADIGGGQTDGTATGFGGFLIG